jgi:hypothetical protein
MKTGKPTERSQKGKFKVQNEAWAFENVLIFDFLRFTSRHLAQHLHNRFRWYNDSQAG